MIYLHNKLHMHNFSGSLVMVIKSHYHMTFHGPQIGEFMFPISLAHMPPPLPPMLSLLTVQNENCNGVNTTLSFKNMGQLVQKYKGNTHNTHKHV
jgi:hypothetical protein